MPLMPLNELAEIRRTVAYEGRTVRLRTWVLKLLEDRTELERRLREATPAEPIAVGAVRGPE